MHVSSEYSPFSLSREEGFNKAFSPIQAEAKEHSKVEEDKELCLACDAQFVQQKEDLSLLGCQSSNYQYSFFCLQ